MSDFEKVPDVVWKLFLEIMWADTGLWGGSPPGKPVELLSKSDRLDAVQMAWGWDPPLMVGPSMTDITLHGLAFATWKERQLRETPKGKGGRPKKGQPTASVKLLAYVTKHPDKVAESAQHFADILDCARSTIQDTPTYKNLAKQRALAKAERYKNRYL